MERTRISRNIMRDRNVWEVSVQGKPIQTFCKSQKAFELKETLEEKGMRGVTIKKRWIDARP